MNISPLFVSKDQVSEEQANWINSQFVKYETGSYVSYRDLECDNSQEIVIINKDQPFLVDSVLACLRRNNVDIQFIYHPIIHVDNDSSEVSLKNRTIEEGDYYSIIYIQISLNNTADTIADVVNEINLVLRDALWATQDWLKMQDVIRNCIRSYKPNLVNIPGDVKQETIAFLQWLLDGNFILLGYREIVYKQDANTDYKVKAKSSLGVLKDEARLVFSGTRNIHKLPEDIKIFLQQPKLIHFNKTHLISNVHRDVPMNVISLKKFDATGNIIGEDRFVGLFTSKALEGSPKAMPIIRRKIQMASSYHNIASNSHDGKAFYHVLETLPKDELYQCTSTELYEIAKGVTSVIVYQQIAIFLRKDAYDRYVTAMVYVPNKQRTNKTPDTIINILEQELNGKMWMFEQGGFEAFERFYITIKIEDDKIAIGEATINERIKDECTLWTEKLRLACADDQKALYNEMGLGFSEAYREKFPVVEAKEDLKYLQKAYQQARVITRLYRKTGKLKHQFRLKLYVLDNPIPLSDILPILENMGLKVIHESNYAVSNKNYVKQEWIHDFKIVTSDMSAVDLQQLEGRFHQAFSTIWDKSYENDILNGLLLRSNLTVRHIFLLRAYTKYLKQIKFAHSITRIYQTLISHDGLADAIYQLFAAKFSPDRAELEITTIRETIADILRNNENNICDTIIKQLVALVDSTLRTNFYHGELYVSLKLDPQKIPFMPKPVMFREIYVYSSYMESIHLRGGAVARGGIRWSDRNEDFKTEILGLVKAQMTKNSVIVPTGSKGGFIIKKDVTGYSFKEKQQEAINCYQTMMRAMLEITDTKSGNQIRPIDGVRYDGDDPYLVVAADKGTATFSDIANDVSTAMKHWLGDAFASGGSHGYDHKKMGITAKGAWEAVKRHFRGLGKNIQAEDFTVVGVGGMAGDVFGNGMLLSQHILLLAAFDHKHIFVDPNPDAKTSFLERKRLFEIAGSSWEDYSKLSQGGRVYDRHAKELKLTAAIKSRFNITQDAISPSELIKHLLRYEAELLWFGGIGTYIKASSQSHSDVGDTSNDHIRVSANEIKVKVIGEGANLAMTQLARIEACRAGVALNTDSIDNSAGVDCSDHEVNIKILFQQVMDKQSLSFTQRNQILADMTEDVERHVLRNNYLQTQAISLEYYQGWQLLDFQSAYMTHLEEIGLLDRKVEFLPDAATMNKLIDNKGSLTKSEIAVLISYAKMDLTNQLSDGVDVASFIQDDLYSYFPQIINDKFRDYITNHSLKNAIIITYLANDIVNRMGVGFIHNTQQQTGASVSSIAKAYLVVRESFKMPDIWQQIEQLDNKVLATEQLELMVILKSLMERCILWVLRNGKIDSDESSVRSLINRYHDEAVKLWRSLDKLLKKGAADNAKRSYDKLIVAKIPKDIARLTSSAIYMHQSFALIEIANRINKPCSEVATIYYSWAEVLKFHVFREKARNMSVVSVWDNKARDMFIEALDSLQRTMTSNYFADDYQTMEAWQDKNSGIVNNCTNLMLKLEAQAYASSSELMVFLHNLQSILNTVKS